MSWILCLWRNYFSSIAAKLRWISSTSMWLVFTGVTPSGYSKCTIEPTPVPDGVFWLLLNKTWNLLQIRSVYKWETIICSSPHSVSSLLKWSFRFTGNFLLLYAVMGTSSWVLKTYWSTLIKVYIMTPLKTYDKIYSASCSSFGVFCQSLPSTAQPVNFQCGTAIWNREPICETGMSSQWFHFRRTIYRDSNVRLREVHGISMFTGMRRLSISNGACCQNWQSSDTWKVSSIIEVYG